MSLRLVSYDVTYETETYTTWYGARKTRTKVVKSNPNQLSKPRTKEGKHNGYTII